MTVDTIVVGTIAILLLGLAIYLWIDRKGWMEIARDAAESYRTAKEAYKELDSFAKALDQENAELTVKCNQYEAILGQRLDDIPVANLDECNQEKCDSGECCKTCGVEGCPDKELQAIPYVRNSDISFKKPCCGCWNGVYNIPACEDCSSENSYENYTPIKY